MTTPTEDTSTATGVFSEEYLAFATMLMEKEPELWRELYDRRLMPKLCDVHYRLMQAAQLQLVSELLEQDEMYHDEGTLQPIMAVPASVLEHKKQELERGK